MNTLHEKFKQLSSEWLAQGIPSREQMISRATALDRWRQENRISTLVTAPVRMVSATLDDGIGQGIEIINLFSQAMGLQVTCLGLVQPADTIIAACREHKPDLLGLTVLQQDSEDDLCQIGKSLAPGTRLVAGGAAFKYDPEMAERCGVDYVADNVAYFIDYVLSLYWSEPSPECG